MVKTAETDIISGTVAGNDPLRTCYDITLELNDTLADVAVACLAERYDLIGNFAGNGCVVFILEPLCGERLDLIAAAVACLSLGHEVRETLAHLFGCDLHTKTEFSEVLEE